MVYKFLFFKRVDVFFVLFCTVCSLVLWDLIELTYIFNFFAELGVKFLNFFAGTVKSSVVEDTKDVVKSKSDLAHIERLERNARIENKYVNTNLAWWKTKYYVAIHDYHVLTEKCIQEDIAKRIAERKAERFNKFTGVEKQPYPGAHIFQGFVMLYTYATISVCWWIINATSFRLKGKLTNDCLNKER